MERKEYMNLEKRVTLLQMTVNILIAMLSLLFME